MAWMTMQAVAGQCGDISVISVVAAQVVHLLKGASCMLPPCYLHTPRAGRTCRQPVACDVKQCQRMA